MSETSNPSAAQPPQELHWGIAYLREDIQDLRHEIRSTHNRIDEVNRSLNERIDEVNRSLGARIDEVNRSLGARIDGVNHSLGARIDGVNHSLGTRIDEKYELLNKAIRSQFTWLMTTMIALAGIIVAVIKL